MLLYTLAGEDAAKRIARATGIADELGYVPARFCTPLDEDSLSRSWAQMASAWYCDPEQIELLIVDDDKCVSIDAVGLERALALDACPDQEAVRSMLTPAFPECTHVLLPPRFEASMCLRMSTIRLAEGDLDDYATNESVRQAVREAVADVSESVAGDMSLLGVLMITGVAPFAWSQATRTDLSTDILSIGALDLLATEGMRRALDLRARVREEGETHESLLAIRSATMDGLDELALTLAERRAALSLASGDDTCFCGSGRPYAECCARKGLDEIARDW